MEGKQKHNEERHAGEAAKFGVFFDDRNYDYTRHLKKIGDSTDAVFIAAPTTELDPARERDQVVTLETTHVTDDLNVDPAIREAIQALDDEEYEDEDFEDDLVVKLDREEDTCILHPVDYKQDREEMIEDEEFCYAASDDGISQVTTAASSLRGGRPTQSIAITSLDSKFEALLKIYDDDLDDVQFESDEQDDEFAAEGIAEALQEFIENEQEYIIAAKNQRSRVAIRNLDQMRQEMGPLNAAILQQEESDSEECEDDSSFEETDSAESFDCQSIISTFSNTTNLPTVIRETTKQSDVPLIRLSRRTGLPIMPRGISPTNRSISPLRDDSSDEQQEAINRGLARSREETTDEKKARKTALKSERRERRANKKEMRVRFQLEEPSKPRAKPKRSSSLLPVK